MWQKIKSVPYGKWLFLLVSAIVVAGFLYFSKILVDDLSERERERMEIWADATKEILRQFGDSSDEQYIEVDDSVYDTPPMPVVDISFLLRILEGNTTIPVLLIDEDGNIKNHRNFDLPEPYDVTAGYDQLSPANQQYLDKKLNQLSGTENVIDIELDDGAFQHLLYEDSKLLQRLSYFPYIQLAVMIVFLLVVYFAVTSSKQAEQNKVWVGLSKETAHQLGTPISSLMAWMELLPEMGTDRDTCAEMDKDVKRLSTIASRFSKIGSRPDMSSENLGSIVTHAAEYMASRVSKRIELTCDIHNENLEVKASTPLFEWVMENLIKNAVDAVEGTGKISINVFQEKAQAIIEISDTGKGIAPKNHKRIFKPGFTTKSRGWGLGLTLAKRIVEQYHSGRIFVKESNPGEGTTFRIELPLSHTIKTK
ncbi:MAG: HAMP domain-containing histidine kinase [Muribaculaceae bacterium]|nr:HAMP domain-containing histidine kinase [Muribaculaceae bacterium]